MEKATVSIIILASIIITSTQVIPTKTCNRIRIGNNWYNRQILLRDVGKPYNLHTHKETNTLFFSYTLPESYSDADFQLAWHSMDTSEYYQTIAGIKGGCAIAVDEDRDVVYLGGSDGIYKFNMQTKLADLYKEKGKNIWGLAYRRNLFYISYPGQKLYIEIDDKFSIVKEFDNFEVDHFFVTTQNVIYFSNKTGLYKFDDKTLKAHVLNELLTVRQIVEDNKGMVYFCTNVGILAVDVDTDEIKKILDIKNVFGLAFDRRNNFIFSDESSIIKLVYSDVGCINSLQW